MSYLTSADDSLAYLMAGLSPDERVRKDSAARAAALRGDTGLDFGVRPRWALENQSAQWGVNPLPSESPPEPSQPMAAQPPGSAAGAPQRPGPALPLAMAARAPAARSTAPAVTNDPLADEYGKLDAREQAAYAEQQRMLQPPDYEKAQEAYQKRAEGGGRQLMLALAAQRAGEGFQPMQAHFLKRAAEAEAPMKMLGGQMTPEGFIEDPEYRQELALKRNDAELRQLAAAKASNVSLQEKARITAREEEVRREMQQNQLQNAQLLAGVASSDRRYQADLAHGDREAALAAKGIGKGTTDPQHVIDLAKEALKYLPEATSSGLGKARDAAGAFFNYSTEGAQNAAVLHSIAGQLTMAQPRMEGPQSDKDTMLYKQMAGDVGNEALPIETRQAALNAIITISKKYQSGEFVPATPQRPGARPPAAPAAPAGGGLPAGWSVQTRP